MSPYRFLGPVVPVVRRLAEHMYACTRTNGMSYMWIGQGYNANNPPEHSSKRFFDFITQNKADFDKGKWPTPQEIADGWIVARWLMSHYKTLRIAWIIYDGRIWNPSRDKYNVWRKYTGGSGVSGGHHNHIHVGVSNAGGVVPSNRIGDGVGVASKPVKPKPTPSKQGFGLRYVTEGRRLNRFSLNVKFVQAELMRRGYNLGPTGADGYWGSTNASLATSYTQRAYDAFRRDQGYKGSDATGSVGKQSLTKLIGHLRKVI